MKAGLRFAQLLIVCSLPIPPFALRRPFPSLPSSVPPLLLPLQHPLPAFLTDRPPGDDDADPVAVREGGEEE